MGPFLFLYSALVGFFAFAALYHFILWWASRRERLLAIFSADCAVRAALSGSLAAIAVSTTTAEAHAAIRARVAIGMLMMITWLWSLTYVSGVRARWFVWPVTLVMLVADVIHTFVIPLNSAVVAIRQVVMPWGEVVVTPQFASPQGWWIRPLYGLGMLIAGFGLVCGRRLWSRDRTAGTLVVLTACGTSAVFVVEIIRSYGQIPVPFLGALPQIFWVCAIAFLIARDHQQTRVALVSSEQRFRGIFDQTFQFIGLMDVDGKLIAANRTALEFAGMREAEVIGKLFWQTPWWAHSPELQEQLRQAVRQAAAGHVVRFEATHPRPDGGIAFVDFSVKPVRDELGRVALLIPEGRDISERKLTEEALRNSETRYRQLVECAPYCIHELDAHGRFVSMNRSGLRMMGLDDATCICGTQYLDAICNADRPRIARLLAAAHAGDASSFEFVAVNGRQFSSNFEPLADGKIMGITLDITERKKTEEALRASQQQLARLFYASPLPEVCYSLADGRILDVNQRFLSLFEISREEAVGRTGLELGFWCDLSQRAELIARIQADGAVTDLDARLRSRGGREFEMVVSAQVIEWSTGPAVILQANDITQRKLADELVRASEERFRALVEHGFEGINIIDGDGKLTFASPSNQSVLGHPADQVRGRSMFEMIHPDDLAQTQSMWATVLKSPEQVFTPRLRFRHRDGSWHWVDVTARNLLHHPAVRGVVVNWRDVSEKKIAEEKLRESEERYRNILESLPLGVFIHDGRQVLYANPQAVQMTGRNKLDVQSPFNPFSIVAPEFVDVMHERVAAVLGRGEILAPIEAAILRVDGSRVPVEITSRRTRFADRDCVQVLCQDITDRKRADEERRKLEAQFVHAQKLESLGVLAGGVAHDFNNLLTVVLGNASMSLSRLPQDSPAREMLHEIEHAAKRAAELTQQMLAYSGKSRFVFAPLRVDEIVRDMAGLLKNVLSKKATVTLDLAPVTVEGDATQIRQVAMNLIINASDALLDKPGAIRISTQVVQPDASELHSPYLPDKLRAKDYVLLEVSDTGCGMDEATKSKIFDPFFTTKFTGRGLGLAAVLGIVRSHEGTVQVTSELGQGTAIRIYIPCAKPLATQIFDRAPLGRQGTILLVDGDPPALALARRVFESAGFDVASAEHGQVAWEMTANSSFHLIAVVLDLFTPQLDIRAFLSELRAEFPNLPVLVMSGYSEQECDMASLPSGVTNFIQKPFSPAQLLAALATILPTAAAPEELAS